MSNTANSSVSRSIKTTDSVEEMGFPYFFFSMCDLIAVPIPAGVIIKDNPEIKI